MPNKRKRLLWKPTPVAPVDYISLIRILQRDAEQTTAYCYGFLYGGQGGNPRSAAIHVAVAYHSAFIQGVRDGAMERGRCDA